MPESTIVVEYLDRFGEAPPLIPTDPDAALQARLWDRVIDGRVQTPMQKIVADNLRPEGTGDAHGVEEARQKLDRIYPVLDQHLAAATGSPARTSPSPTAPPPRRSSTPASSAAGTRTALADLTRYYEALAARPSVARVIDEARHYRELFPLPWPDHVE